MEGVECACMGRGCVHMEGFECACMGRVCIWKGSRRAWGKGVYMDGVEWEDVCIWKNLSVHAWGEDVCIYGRFECECMGRGCVHMEVVEWCAWGEGEGDVYLEGVECVCMGRGRVCIRKGWSVRAWGGVCAYGRVECVH